MDLESSVLIEISHMENKNYMISLLYQIQNKKQLVNKQNKETNLKLIDTDKRMAVTRGEGVWGDDEESKGDQIYGDRRLGFSW